MATYRLQPAQPLAADGHALDRVLRQGGVAKGGEIHVTGPAGLTAVLWLYRHGYANAAYVQAHRVSAMRQLDVLLVPHPCTTRELAGMLGDGACLNDGGLLIVQSPANRDDQGLDTVPTLLRSLGYQLEHRLGSKGHTVHIARRCGLGGFRKAA